MKKLTLVLGVIFALAILVLPNLSWAATATATATVSATINPSATLQLIRDTNSVARGSTTQILFDRRDDQDVGVSNPSAGVMYAPYRSETGKNWHLANVVAIGATMTLSATVSGTIGTTPLASVMRVWCGGFFSPGALTPIQGTATVDDGNPATDDWEFLNGFQRTLNSSFIGTVPFSYRLTITGLPSGGPFSGTVTFTLTTT